MQDGLHHVASGISDCHREMKDKFNRLFDQIVRTGNDGPGPAEPAHEAADPETPVPWGKLYSEWLRQRATYAEGAVSDEERDRLDDREAELVHEMITTPAPTSYAILEKIDILRTYMDIGDGWTDKRDTLLLASIRADVHGME